MKLGILWKVLIPVLLVVALATGGGFYFAYDASRSAMENIIEEELKTLDMLLVRNIEHFIETVKRDLQNLSRLQRLHNALFNENEQTIKVASEALAQFSKDYEYIESVGIVDPEGRIVASSDAEIIGLDIKDRDYVKNALSGKPDVSEPIASRLSGNYVFVVSYPIEVNGKIVGALFGSVPVMLFSDEIIKDVTIDKTGYPYIIAKSGLTIAHPKTENVGQDQIQKFDWGKKIMSTDNGVFHYQFNNSEKLAAVMSVKDLGWKVVFTIDQSDIDSATAPAVWASFTSMAAVLLLITGSMFFLMRFYVSRPLGIMAREADKVANGNFNIDTAKMERFLANKGELTSTHYSIGRMLAALKENISLAEQKTKDAAKQTELAQAATATAEEATRRAESAKTEGMQAAASELEDVISIISSAASELSAQIEQSEVGAGEQAARVSEAATAMEEMNATVIEVAQNATSAAQISANTRAKADEGARIVSDVVESIRNVQRQSVSLKEDMGILSEHAQAITQIMGVVSDIADQTNLLALNAAIEAARAGEAGRGFAVVADEVRKLAEKTMSSTSDVDNAIKGIQQSAAKNMEQVDLTVKTIETATELADTSGQVLRGIVGMADETADQVSSIATASEEQSAASEEINRSITQVNTIASETSIAMHEAAQAVTDLASQANHLKNLVTEMKNA